MTEKIEKQILEISSMIDGVNIGLERARELRDKLLLQGEQETLGLDALIEILRKDKAELKTEMKEFQQRLEIKPEIFEDGINPDPDDWNSELEAIKEADQSLRDHVNRRL